MSAISLQDKTITVFGGTGFLGRHIIQHLAKTGATIRVATRLPQKAYFLRPYGRVGQIVPMACNIHNDDSVARTLEGSDIAVNLVGILYEKGKSTFNAIHVDTPARIARLSRQKGLSQLIHVSALGADPAATSNYARSKAAGEIAVLNGFSNATVLRPSIVFGHEDNFFNKFAQMAQFAPCLPLIGGGHTKFQPVYVADIAKAVEEIVLQQATGHHNTSRNTYEMTGPRIYSFKDLMLLMLAETGQKVGLMPIPFPLAKILATFTGLLPVPPLTRDQVDSLKTDNIGHPQAPGLKNLGIRATALETVLPTYMDKFREGGRFTKKEKPVRSF